MPASWEQGYQTGAKQGTVMLGLDAGSGWSDLATDLSQEATNLTSAASSAYETTATRFNISHPRTIHLSIEVDTGSSGTLYDQGTGSTRTRLRVDGSQNLIAEYGGATLGTLALPGVSGTLETYEVAWISVENPDTTSVSDLVASWLIVHTDGGAGSARLGPFFHRAKGSTTAEARFGADAGGGSTYTDTVNTIGFHRREMTLAEIYNDWVGSTSVPTVEGEILRQDVPLDVSSGIGDQNELQGPPGAWAAYAHRHLRRRTMSGRSIPLYADTLSTTFHTSNEHVRLAPESSDYRINLAWIFAVPVPPTASHLWIRVHADLWVTSGAAVPTGIRAIVANRPPQLANAVGAEAYEQRHRTAVVTRDDGGSGSGAWSFAELVPIVRGTEGLRQGWAYVMLAYAFDPANASANDANARAIFNMVQIAPEYVPPDPGDLPHGGEAG